MIFAFWFPQHEPGYVVVAVLIFSCIVTATISITSSRHAKRFMAQTGTLTFRLKRASELDPQPGSVFINSTGVMIKAHDDVMIQLCKMSRIEQIGVTPDHTFYIRKKGPNLFIVFPLDDQEAARIAAELAKYTRVDMLQSAPKKRPYVFDVSNEQTNPKT